jgi:hypothetical protein
MKLSRKKDVGQPAGVLSLFGSTDQSGHYWLLNKDGSLAVAEYEREWLEGDILSFSHDEDVMCVAKKNKRSEAMSELIGEKGWAVEGQWIGESYFGTRRERAIATSNLGRIYSGKQLLCSMVERFHKEADWALSERCVVGVVFSGDPTMAVVLFTRELDGVLTNQSYLALQDNDPKSAIEAYVQNTALDQSGQLPDNRLIIFTGGELLGSMQGLQPYPSERSFAQVKFSTWQTGAVYVLALGVLGVGSFVGWREYQLFGMARTIEAQSIEIAQLQSSNRDGALTKHGAILESTSIDVGEGLRLAKEIHIDGTKVQLLSSDKGRFRIKLIVRNDYPEKDLNLVVANRTVQGCEKPISTTPRGMRETHYEYVCQSQTSFFNNLLGSAR